MEQFINSISMHAFKINLVPFQYEVTVNALSVGGRLKKMETLINISRLLNFFSFSS